jgi:hypothetical protein
LEEESRAVEFILKVYRDFRQTMIEVNIWGAFVIIEFTHYIDKILYGLFFDQEKFGQSPGFVEFWERSLSFESLLKWQRESKFV